MKKSLIALAVLGATSTFAMAANVTLYGVVDTGLQFNRVDSDKPGVDAVNTLEMKAGAQSGNRWGIKGVEELGNGMAVGFVLEGGFNLDDGQQAQNKGVFSRESQIFVRGNFGELSMGRVGNLASGNGTYGIAGSLSPFGTSWSGINAVEGSTYMVGYDRFDNTVTYKTPTFNGLNAYAQYSMKTSSSADGTENKANATRYAALGATYGAGALKLVAVVDTYIYGHAIGESVDDGLTVTAGGSYDFGTAKAYFGANYFDDIKATTAGVVKDIGIGQTSKGYGIMTGVDIPACGGVAKVALGYVDGEAVQGSDEFKRYGASVGYTYDLSKRTNLYTVASYNKDELKVSGVKTEPTNIGLSVGIRHKF